MLDVGGVWIVVSMIGSCLVDAWFCLVVLIWVLCDFGCWFSCLVCSYLFKLLWGYVGVCLGLVVLILFELLVVLLSVLFVYVF